MNRKITSSHSLDLVDRRNRESGSAYISTEFIGWGNKKSTTLTLTFTLCTHSETVIYSYSQCVE